MGEVKNYKLYVGGLQKIPDNIRFSYYNSRHQYFLIFSNEEPKGEFLEVIPETMQELDSDERAWLASCKLSLSVETMNSASKEISQSLTSFAEILENELKKEAEIIKKNKKE